MIQVTQKQYVGEPCRKCGSPIRAKCSGDCVRCAVSRIARWRREHPDAYHAQQKRGYRKDIDKSRAATRARAKRSYHKHRDRRMAAHKSWTAANQTHVVAYRGRTKERKQLTNIQYRRLNRAARTAYNKQWRRKHPEAVRRRRVMLHTPPWADRDAIRAIYLEARRLGLTVDHNVPLRGKLVSGLHIPGNLRIVPLMVNLRKSNTYGIGSR